MHVTLLWSVSLPSRNLYANAFPLPRKHFIIFLYLVFFCTIYLSIYGYEHYVTSSYTLAEVVAGLGGEWRTTAEGVDGERHRCPSCSLCCSSW